MLYGERWDVVESLGEGGQAHTFLVRDIKGSGESRYVLKRLKNPNRINRFGREIEAIRSLQHENIVNLLDFDLQVGKPYLVTEYCVGGSLDKANPYWRSSPVVALELFAQVCQGVAHAHNNGIVHRDIKPENIFLRKSDGSAVVGDFGICYLEDDGTRFTLTEEAVGPRLFMAPELEDGRATRITDKSDIYSLGKVLYWLLSGRVFSREKYREREWDLKGQVLDPILEWDIHPELGWKYVYMEHVNRLLDLMIVDAPEKRRDINNILILLKQVTKLVAKEYNPVSAKIKQPCTYCGQGFYRMPAQGTTGVRNFGFVPVGASDWRILVCDTCGHVQTFRVDMASQKEWWS